MEGKDVSPVQPRVRVLHHWERQEPAGKDIPGWVGLEGTGNLGRWDVEVSSLLSLSGPIPGRRDTAVNSPAREPRGRALFLGCFRKRQPCGVRVKGR